MDVKPFLKMVADSCPRCAVIPSHIWTPWFSLFGANSGFDSIEECFEEMTPFIFALETGLSSDPPMNRGCRPSTGSPWSRTRTPTRPRRSGGRPTSSTRTSATPGSSAPSGRKDPSKFLHTVEFFPEEGKYHYDGHRKCGVVFAPGESLAHNDICPKCGKKLTIGVMHRVEELADRALGGRGPVPDTLPEPHSAQRDRRRGPGEEPG